MYVPDVFALDDPARVADLLRGYSFALLVSAREGQAPDATHIPIHHDPDRGPNGTLLGHMARANGKGPTIQIPPVFSIKKGQPDIVA